MDNSDMNAFAGKRPYSILLAEDNEADIKITLRAFDKAQLKNNIFVVRNGQQALDYMYHRAEYADAAKFPRPDIIVLDINMPVLTGYEVMETLKKDKAFRLIPIIMLTSSKSEEDIVKSYDNGAASFIQKPVEYERFVKVVEGFNVYWQVLNKLPDMNRP
jgi:CheY-like chemotaxis protein